MINQGSLPFACFNLSHPQKLFSILVLSCPGYPAIDLEAKTHVTSKWVNLVYDTVIMQILPEGEEFLAVLAPSFLIFD